MNSSRSISRSFFSSSRNPFRNFLRFFFQEFLQYLCLSFLTDSWSFIFQNFQKHGLSQKLAQDFSHKFLQKFLIKFFWIFLWSHLKEFIKVLPEEGFSWRIPWTTKLKDSLFSDISTKKKECAFNSCTNLWRYFQTNPWRIMWKNPKEYLKELKKSC